MGAKTVVYSEKIWLVEIEGKAAGPYTEEQLARWLETGHVRPDSFVQHRNDTEWVRAEDRASAFPRIERQRRLDAAIAELKREENRYSGLESKAGCAHTVGVLCIVFGVLGALAGMGNQSTAAVAAGASLALSGLLMTLASHAVAPLIDIARATRALQRDVEQRGSREQK